MDISCPYGGERHVAGTVYVPYCRLPDEETPQGPIPGSCSQTQTDCRYRPHLHAARQTALNRLRDEGAAVSPPPVMNAWRPPAKRGP